MAKIDELRAQIEKLELEKNQLGEKFDKTAAQLIAEREEAVEKERNNNSRIIDSLKSQHSVEIEKLNADFEARLESTTKALNEKLNNSQIDLNSLKGNDFRR